MSRFRHVLIERTMVACDDRTDAEDQERDQGDPAAQASLEFMPSHCCLGRPFQFAVPEQVKRKRQKTP